MSPEHFLIVAGQDAHDQWEKKMQEGLAQGQPLTTLQEKQAQEGLIFVEICPTLYGWSVRYGSGLQNFDVLASARKGTLDGTKKDALRFATEWVAQDPQNRYAFLRKAYENLDDQQHPFK